MINKPNIGNLSSFVFAFIVFGYPIQTIIPLFVDIDHNTLNLNFRILLLLFSILLLFLCLPDLIKKTKINKGWMFFLMFWLVYSIRLLYDLEFRYVQFLNYDSFYVYSFAFGVCLIPSLAIYQTINYASLIRVVWIVFSIILLSNLSIVYSIMNSSQWDLNQVLLTRAALSLESDGELKSILNPITIGYSGMCLSIISIHLLNFPINNNRLISYMFYISLTIGFFVLVIGASRGPFLIFFILIIIELFFLAKKFGRVKLLLFKTSILVILICSGLLMFTRTSNSNTDVQLISRLTDTYQERKNNEKEERDYEWSAALNQFLNSPIIGDSFVNSYDNSYSHNIYLDVLMSTGLIGAFFFISFHFFLIKKIYYFLLMLKTNSLYSIFVILLIASLLGSLVSGGLFVSTNFWLTSSLILALK